MSTPPPYEIELVPCAEGAHYHCAILATITGLPEEEILARLPEQLREAERWRGQSFIEVARLLGYNCNRQFVRFDARTRWPCILRVKEPSIENGWWALVYANGSVYDVWGEWVKYLDDFLRERPEAIITSMLQIWIP